MTNENATILQTIITAIIAAIVTSIATFLITIYCWINSSLYLDAKEIEKLKQEVEQIQTIQKESVHLTVSA